MLELDIQVDVKDATRYLRGVQRKAIPKAETRALNKVLTTVRKEAVQEVWKRRRLKKSVIRKRLTIRRANRRQPFVRITASTRRISLREYSGKLAGRGANKYVVANITGERQIFRHAFVPISKHGHIFERVGEARYPIKLLTGPSIGSALKHAGVRSHLFQTAGSRWPVVFQQELNFALSKLR